MPAFTNSGSHTFGCLVNGEVWIPKGMYSSLSLDKFFPNTIIITAETRKSLIRLAITDSTGIKANKLYDLAVKSTYGSEFVTSESGSNCFYDAEHIITGHLIFKRYDDIISGTFEFTTLNPNCKNPVKIVITEGRFDMKQFTGQ